MTVNLIYIYKTSTFQKFIHKDSPVSILTRSIQSPAIEMYKEANNVSPEIMKEVFNFCGEIDYDLKQQNIFRQPLFNSVYNSTERISFLGSKILEIIPKNMKKLESFKKK